MRHSLDWAGGWRIAPLRRAWHPIKITDQARILVTVKRWLDLSFWFCALKVLTKSVKWVNEIHQASHRFFEVLVRCASSCDSCWICPHHELNSIELIKWSSSPRILYMTVDFYKFAHEKACLCSRVISERRPRQQTFLYCEGLIDSINCWSDWLLETNISWRRWMRLVLLRSTEEIISSRHQIRNLIIGQRIRRVYR